MSKIGILGGTFDPIHNGHLYMANAAMEQLKLDMVMFIPSGIVPHKNNEKITEATHRYNMVCEAVKDYENYLVSDIEIKRASVCYTYETLGELRKTYVDDELHFIIGADSMYYIDKWRKPEEIFKLAYVTVVDRTTDTCHNIDEYCRNIAKNYNGTVELLSAHGPEISSTEIREYVKSGKSIKGMVPELVNDYITEHKLYMGF